MASSLAELELGSPRGGAAWIAVLFAILSLEIQAAELPLLSELIDASRAATVETTQTLSDGTSAVVRTATAADPLQRYHLPSGWPAPRPALPGAALAVGEQLFSNPARPIAIQPLDDGRVLIGLSDSVLEVTGGTTRHVLEVGARSILPSEDGRLLLIQTNSDPPILIVDSETLQRQREISPSPPPVDRAFWGETSESLLFVREGIDFRPEERDRIFVFTSAWSLAQQHEEPLSWSSQMFASVGFIAPAGVLWAQNRQPFQIDPYPAPLVLLNHGKAKGALTGASEEADILPSAGSDGWLYWIRTRKRVGLSGRLMCRNARDTSGPDIQLTSSAVVSHGVSPKGGFVAYAVPANDSMAAGPRPVTVRLATRDEMRSVDGTATARADVIMAAKWHAIQQTLDHAFDATDLGRTMIRTDAVRELSRPPTGDELDAMGVLFENLVGDQFAIAVENGALRLDILDAILDDSEGILHEEPAEILAIGGAFVRAARRVEAGTLLLSTARPELSAPLDSRFQTDGMTTTLASPFEVARERLSGRVRLADALHEITSRGTQPVFFVENYSDTTHAAVRTFMLGIAGLAAKNPGLDDLARALERFPKNAALAMATFDAARAAGDANLEVLAATRLVAQSPASPEAFMRLAEGLSDARRGDDAGRAAEWAIDLDPENTRLRTRYGHILMDQNRLELARAAYQATRGMKDAQDVSDEVQSRLEVITSILAERGK